jgi:hypothetical protein
VFIAHRPRVEDDPLYAVRLAIMSVVGLFVGIALRSPLASVFPVMMYALMATNRKAFDPGRVFAAPIIFSAALWIMSGVVVTLQGMPLALLAATALIYFTAFYLIQRTGNAMGLLLIVAMALMSIMALGSYASMTFLRSEMTKAALATAIVSPVLYWLLPAATTEKNVDVTAPAYDDGWAVRAAIRTVVMFIYTPILFTFLDASNIFLAIAGMFVLVQSRPGPIWTETRMRIESVLLGGVLVIAMVAVLQLTGHFVVLVALLFLVTLWLGQNILTGPGNYRLYHEAGTVMISLVGGIITSTEPGYAFFQRAALTLVSTVLAALLISWLDARLVKPAAPKPSLA